MHSLTGVPLGLCAYYASLYPHELQQGLYLTVLPDHQVLRNDSLHAAETDMARTLLYELNSVSVWDKATMELIILAFVSIILLTVQTHAGDQTLKHIQPARVLNGFEHMECTWNVGVSRWHSNDQ